MRLKCSPKPIVAASFGWLFGTDCQTALHSSAMVAAEDLHMGFTEANVGLIPAGGGIKELLLRAAIDLPETDDRGLGRVGYRPFDAVLFAKVSGSGKEARELFLSSSDKVVQSGQSPIEMAKRYAQELVRTGYRRECPDMAIPVAGRSGMYQLQHRIERMYDSGAIREENLMLAVHLARVLCGGDVPAGTVTEQQILDLEREAFLSLLGMENTQERIRKMAIKY